MSKTMRIELYDVSVMCTDSITLQGMLHFWVDPFFGNAACLIRRTIFPDELIQTFHIVEL